MHAFDTPNGRRISVASEETALPYAVTVVDIRKGQQKEPEFLEISPNGRIPAIVDPEGPHGKHVSVFESGAILIYLGEKTGKFWPQDLGARIPILDGAPGRPARIRGEAQLTRPDAPSSMNPAGCARFARAT